MSEVSLEMKKLLILWGHRAGRPLNGTIGPPRGSWENETESETTGSNRAEKEKNQAEMGWCTSSVAGGRPQRANMVQPTREFSRTRNIPRILTTPAGREISRGENGIIFFHAQTSGFVTTSKMFAWIDEGNH